MFRGTTPCLAFKLPFIAEKVIKSLIVTIQNRKIRKVIINRTEKECEFQDNYIVIGLTQQETLSFGTKDILDIQLRILTKGDNAYASPIYNLSVDKILNEEIMGIGLNTSANSTTSNLVGNHTFTDGDSNVLEVEFPNCARSFDTEIMEVYPVKGDKGDKGTTFIPSIDSLGNVSWTNTDGLPNPETVNVKGEKGDNGYTPYIGDNKNWWIDGRDTGNPSTGQKGDKGDNGDITPEYRQMYEDTIAAKDIASRESTGAKEAAIQSANSETNSKRFSDIATEQATKATSEANRSERAVDSLRPLVEQHTTQINDLSKTKANEADLSVVAKTGLYKDILDRPEAVSQFANDANYINNAVQDLQYYYLKTETYTQKEIDNRISLIPKFSIEVVSQLPTDSISHTTVYLLKTSTESQNVYEEFIYVNGEWEKLGSQKVDLTNYYDKQATDDLLSKKADISYVDTGLGEKASSTELNSLKSKVESLTRQVAELESALQNMLRFS